LKPLDFTPPAFLAYDDRNKNGIGNYAIIYIYVENDVLLFVYADSSVPEPSRTPTRVQFVNFLDGWFLLEEKEVIVTPRKSLINPVTI
jgi:hypothetical protein